MKSYNKFIIMIIVVIMAIFVGANWYICRMETSSNDRPYLVEISRLTKELENGMPDISSCKYVKKISPCEDEEVITTAGKFDYCIRRVGDKLYRFDYIRTSGVGADILLTVNAILLIMSALVIGIVLYIYKRIIKPFHTLEEVPYELSKGNLMPAITEDKSKYFGKFVWGLDMLRENIEQRRENELAMHRDNKLLMLSLTHDIKTPLSVIKLNAQAIEKGLFKEEERIKNAASVIDGKVNEIEQYVSQMTAASKDDFLDLKVQEGEFYLSDVIDAITTGYSSKLELRKTSLVVTEFSNCILAGDKERVIEVLQNLMENAIKYGDGQWIRLGFEREEGCQLISVESSGASLPKEELPKVFDSFFRGTNSGKQSGSGLGLYICRQLMHKMNGDIFVKENDEAFSVTVVIRMQ